MWRAFSRSRGRAGGLRILDVAAALSLVGALVLVRLMMPQETVTGSVRVVDGDTLAFGERRIRLLGVDAPELMQTCERGGAVYRCGEVARERLRELTRSGDVLCRRSGEDRFGRMLATCGANSRDLGADLVRSGMAVADGRYEAEERHAVRERAGLWAGSFVRPSEWRRRHASSGPD